MRDNGREIHVIVESSREVGGCNGCTTYSTANGTAVHDVWVVTLRYASVRLCRECVVVLLKRLRSAEV